MDREAWRAEIHGVAKSRTRLSNGTPLQYSCLEKPMDGGAWWATVHGVAQSWARLSDFTFTFHFHALEKEMAIHPSTLAWKIPWTEKPDRLTNSRSLLKLMSVELVMPSNHLILCQSLLFPSSIFLSIRAVDPCLHRRHSKAGLAQSLWGFWVLVRTRFV